MKTIGFIDYYLDEWHANEYPGFFAKITDQLKVTHAFAAIDSPKGGLTTDQWCAQKGIARADSIDEVVDKCDYVIVFSPDNPEQHEALSHIPLMSGKRIYIDKTFATNRAAASRMFELADKYNTPMYSTSALRFAKELETVKTENIAFVDSRGPGTFEIYGIHQFEPLVRIMGTNVKRVMYIGNKVSPSFVIEFTDGRRAVTSHFGWECPFNLAVNYDNGKEIGNAVLIPDLTEYFDHFIEKLVTYFETGEIPVPKEQTMAVVTLIECAYRAAEKPSEWIYAD